MTIKLKYNKDKIIDIKEFNKKYEVTKNYITRGGEKVYTINADNYIQKYEMLKGTPLLVTVEGSHVELDSLLDMASDKDKRVVNDYISCVRAKAQPPFINFIWKRDSDGRLC